MPPHQSGGNDPFHTRPMLPEVPRLQADFAACTIIAKNYLPMARVLAESFREKNPGCPFFVLLMDPVEGRFHPEQEPFHALETRQLSIPNLEGLLFKYNILEASTAVKPYLLAKLFAEHAMNKLLYLDPDILILRPLRELSETLDRCSVALIPHITQPYPDTAKPGDHDILQAGSFNLGFLGLRNTPVTQQLLGWWQRKVFHHCLVSFERNLFVDQRWMDLAPSVFDEVTILRHPGYNVAYWNLHERRITIERDEVLANNAPCFFFHFSGFNPDKAAVVSKHQTRFKMRDLGAAQELFDRYRRLLLDKGWNEAKQWSYTYDFFDNGVRIPESARKLYWSLGENTASLGNPFTWMNGSEPRAAAPEAAPPPPRAFGVNLVGYVASEKGVGEAVRSNLRIIKAAEVPYVVNNFEDSGSANLERLSESISRTNPYSVNLINVNADQMPYFAERNNGYLAHRYNIGFWAWELEAFPAEWCGSFGYLNEVWVPSNFTRQSVAAVSPLPVTCVPHCIDPDLQPASQWTRERLGLPTKAFIFLFFFDFHSFLERKNPLGLIRAFKKAFGDSRDTLLLIKSAHAGSCPEELRLLRAESGSANIRVFDEVLSRAATHSFMNLADCYVSLHRSEGFGLTMAEAMSCGKPVIATGYSGNVDFMNQENSFLVRHRLVEIERDHGPYKKGWMWADPDVDHAAECMRRVFEDRTLASEVGERGRAYVTARLHPNTIAEVVKSRLAALDAGVAAALRA